MKKIVPAVTLTLILISTLSVMFNIKPVKSEWTEPVYIRVDGSVDPPNAPIIALNSNTYVLTDNIKVPYKGKGIVIERDNIILDGANHKVEGVAAEEGSFGIYAPQRVNVTIRNLKIEVLYYGIYLWGSYNNIITQNNFYENGYGIYMSYSYNNEVSLNYIINEGKFGIGIYLSNSENNEIYGNTIRDNIYGIMLSSSSKNNMIYDNDLINCGVFIDDSYENEITDNRVNYKPLVYLKNISDILVKNAGQVILIKCNRIHVEGLNLCNVTPGIYLLQTNNSIIKKNTLNNNFYGIILDRSCGNTVVNNFILDQRWIGIYLVNSDRNEILKNEVTRAYYGIRLIDCSSNIISENIVSEITPFDGICVAGNCFFNNISDNTVMNCGVGINIASDMGTISRNIFLNNDYGIIIYNAVANRIYHNKFINNSVQAETGQSSNDWDNGYPSGGNYWSDYRGVDMRSGPNQDQPGSDGIGDTPYVIDSFNIDRYPLILQITDETPPITSHDYDNLWHTSDFIVTLTAVDDRSGVKETFYKINNGPTMSVSSNGHPRFTMESANNTLEYWSVDNMGNEEQHKFLNGIKLDKTPPSISIIAPLDGTVFSESTIIFNVSASDHISGVSKVELYIDGQLRGDMYYDGTQYTLTVPSITEGSHIWYAKAYDNAGWTAITPITTFTIHVIEVLTGNLSVNVRDLDGNPIIGATVLSFVQPSGQQILSGITNSQGYALFDNIIAGSYVFEISKQGYQTVIKEARVYPNQTTSVIVNLAPLINQEKPSDHTPLYYVGGVIGLFAVITITYFLIKRKPSQHHPSLKNTAQSSETQKYRRYLEKLEEKYRNGEISEDVYQKLKREYLEKLRGYEE
ncbi:MAG: NosD domain-containing protein [Candidatus Bathyarchaeia archaeon]